MFGAYDPATLNLDIARFLRLTDLGPILNAPTEARILRPYLRIARQSDKERMQVLVFFERRQLAASPRDARLRALTIFSLKPLNRELRDRLWFGLRWQRIDPPCRSDGEQKGYDPLFHSGELLVDALNSRTSAFIYRRHSRGTQFDYIGNPFVCQETFRNQSLE